MSMFSPVKSELALERYILQEMFDRMGGWGFEEMFLSLSNFSPPINKEVARGLCRSLSERGYAKYSRALTTDDGQFAGAGYGITKAGAEYLKTITPHPYEAAVVEAIQFALDADEGMEFLRLWNHGEWEEIDEHWPEFYFLATGAPRRMLEWTTGEGPIAKPHDGLMYVLKFRGYEALLKCVELPFDDKNGKRTIFEVLRRTFSGMEKAKRFAQSDYDKRQIADYERIGR